MMVVEVVHPDGWEANYQSGWSLEMLPCLTKGKVVQMDNPRSLVPLVWSLVRAGRRSTEDGTLGEDGEGLGCPFLRW